MSKSKRPPVKMTASQFATAERAYEQIAMESQQRLAARGTTSDVWYVDDPRWSPTFVTVEPADDAVMASFTGKVTR